MQEYNLEIQHIPGSENVVADALSRFFGYRMLRFL